MEYTPFKMKGPSLYRSPIKDKHDKEGDVSESEKETYTEEEKKKIAEHEKKQASMSEEEQLREAERRLKLSTKKAEHEKIWGPGSLDQDLSKKDSEKEEIDPLTAAQQPPVPNKFL